MNKIIYFWATFLLFACSGKSQEEKIMNSTETGTRNLYKWPFSQTSIWNMPIGSQYVFDDQDIYGSGMVGAHGGSGLSAIGGALRCGELTPTSGAIRHALKMNLFGRKNIYCG